MEITVYIHNLFGSISLPGKTSQGGASCQGCRRQTRQISEWPGAILVAYQLIDISIGACIDDLLCTASLPGIGGQRSIDCQGWIVRVHELDMPRRHMHAARE